MSRPIFGLAVVAGFFALAPAAQAQFTPSAGGFSDPFFLYYGWYLPRQAAIAAQPSTPNQLNDVVAARQNYAVADRAGLYDPIASPFNLEQYDPSMPSFGQRRGAERLPTLPSIAARSRKSNGQAPAPWYNKTARYFPEYRSDSRPNANMATTRRGGMGGGFGMGMAGGMGMGMPY